MGVGSALKGYWEYKKTQLLVIVFGVVAAILVVGGLIWYILVGAPTWNSFAENFVNFFSLTGNSFLLTFADLQSYLLYHWVDLVLLISLIGGVLALTYVLAKVHKKKRRAVYAVAALVVIGFSSVGLIGSLAVQKGLIQNPYFTTPAEASATITHQYILVQFTGTFRDGYWGNDAALDVGSVTVTEQTAVGDQTQLRWQLTSHTWTVDEQDPVAIARVYITIKYSDGSAFGEEQLWQGSYDNGAFNWNLRIDCPTGKNPTSFTLKITELDYTWLIHHGYTVRYLNTWSL